MTMTNLEAFNCIQLMNGLNETGRLGYAIAKNMRKLADELKEYTQKRDELIMKYGTKENEQYRIEPKNAKMFLKELEEYDDIEFEYAPHTVSEDIFCSGSLNSQQMYRLAWMVKEE